MEPETHKVTLRSSREDIIKAVELFNKKGSPLKTSLMKEGFNYKVSLKQHENKLDFRIVVSPPIFHLVWRGKMEVEAVGEVVPNNSVSIATFTIKALWKQIMIEYLVVSVIVFVLIMLGCPKIIIPFVLVMILGNAFFEYINAVRYIENLPRHFREIFDAV